MSTPHGGPQRQASLSGSQRTVEEGRFQTLAITCRLFLENILAHSRSLSSRLHAIQYTTGVRIPTGFNLLGLQSRTQLLRTTAVITSISTQGSFSLKHYVQRGSRGHQASLWCVLNCRSLHDVTCKSFAFWKRSHKHPR
jgi:hypothetical protein